MDLDIKALKSRTIAFGPIFFCRQCLPDSTIPQGLAKQADVAFCFMPGA
jgi:hypothetical protein